MRTKKWLFVFVVVAMLLAGCGPTPAPQVVEKVVTEIVKETVKETVVVAGTPEIVEKEVTKVVETQVEKVITATPEPTATPVTEPQRGGTLNMSLGTDFVNFDPFLDIDAWEFKPMVFEAPIRFSDQFTFEPWLAESFEISPDGMSVILHLRKGVMFHTGREMTADDVIWSVDRARDQTLGHHLADRFTTCTGATKIDDSTVQINYSQVEHSALDGIARLYIFPKEAVDDISTVPVGTGPFKYVEWVPGDHLTLERFDDYWREGEPYLDKVVIKPIPDEQARMVNLLAGAIDLLAEVPLADITLLEQAPGVNVIQQPPGFSFDAFIFNVTRPPFDNTQVRQAMNYAVDREKMRELAYHGQAIMTVLPYAPTSWAYPKDLEDYYTFDLDKAKELLTEAGYPDGFQAQMLIRGTGGVALDVAQVYKEDLAKIGVDLEIVPTELPQYWPLLFDSDFQVVSHATGEATIDPSGLFVGAACCRPFRNFFMITENTTWFPQYKEILDKAALELDQEQRKQDYHDALVILEEQGWTIPLGWRQYAFAAEDFVRDLRIDMDALIWLNQTWIAPH
jgi:peptide/nickel transport system substrate-binding protein